MDTPAAAPNQLVSGLEFDLAPQAASTLLWITFGGLTTESSSAFVQSVQRIGFQQGRSKDDTWMAEYAATCFEGLALVWYTALDDEVRESWKKLRASLLVKYPPVIGEQSPPLSNAPQRAIIPSAPIGARTSPASTSPTHSRVGKVELLGKHTAPRGYLSFNPTSGIEITADKDNAVTVSFPIVNGQDVFQLEMVNIPGRTLPYMGIALLVPQGKDQYAVPDMLPGVSNYPGRTISYYYGVPEPSSTCRHSIPANSSNAQYFKVPLATWTFSACGESEKLSPYRRRSQTDPSGRRAVAAVWKHDENTEELTMYWLMDNDSEHKCQPN